MGSDTILQVLQHKSVRVLRGHASNMLPQGSAIKSAQAI